MKHTKVLEHSTAIVTVTVEKEEWKEVQDKAYAKLAKDVTVQGFRKGNAPLEMAKKHIDVNKMFDKAYEEIVDKAYAKVMEEEKFDIVCQPKVDVTKLSFEEFEFKFIIPVKPEFTLGEYKGIEVSKEKVEVTEEEIEHQLKQIQEQNAVVKAKPEGEKIAVGDVVRFDFEGFVDGKAFEGGKAENYELEIGSHAFIPGFEEGMVGLEKGYKGDLPVKFPEQYTPELAGKDAIFKINIKEISTKELPELNDELALDASIDGVTTLEELKANIKENIEHGKDRAAEDKAYGLLMDELVKKNEMELPELLVEDDMDRNLERFKQDVAQRGLDFNRYLEIVGKEEKEVREELREQTVKNLKAMFILNEIAVKEDIKVTNEEVDAEIEKIASQYNMDPKQVHDILEKNQSLGQLSGELYSRKMMDFLKANNKFVVKAKTAAKKTTAKKETTTK